MNTRRALAISRRIADLFRRDHRTLALLFVAPLVILALLGWVMRDQAPPPARVAVIDQTGAPAGEVLRGRIGAAVDEQGMTYVEPLNQEDLARLALADEELDVALVLPPTLPDDMRAGRSPTITLITPGVVPTNDAGRITELQAALRDSLDLPLPQFDHQTVFGRAGADFLESFTPALVGFLVFFLVFVLTGISFLRERIGGTLERLLATPVRRSEIVIGYSLGFAFFATLQVALVLAFVLASIRIEAIGPLPPIDIGLGVASAGSPGLAFLVTLLLAICAVNLGIFLSTFARTELQILQFIPIVIVPQGLLAGIFWPVDSLPGLLEPLGRLMPMTYGIDGLREVLVKGAGLESAALQLDLAVLAAISLLLAVMATLTIRREVA